MRSFAGAAELTTAQLREAPVHWPRPSVLDVSLQVIPGVGPKLAAAAAEAGISTVGDLLYRVPHSYRDREDVRALADLEPGEEATVLVEVVGPHPRPFRKRGGLSILTAKVEDETGSARATWFNQPWLAEKMSPGTALLLVGSRDKRGFRVTAHEFLATGGGEEGSPRTDTPARPQDSPPPRLRSARGVPPGIHTTGLVPVHSATEELKPQRIREWAWRACEWAPNAVEGLPAEIRARRNLAAVGDALRGAHFPASAEDLAAARERLAFEELFLHQAILATRKRTQRRARPAPRFGKPGELVGPWIDSLPFELTVDQLGALDDVDADIDRGEPMQRLLMGEVGSGKTVVAVYAMLRALEAGFQAVLMAPTETLAEQHALTLDRLLGAEAIPFALLTGATPAAARKRALGQLASGELGLAVGTHALIEPTVRFARLGLSVVDEQHRFGVEQRRALDEKGVEGMAPHVLHMTATPIPRTLSLTAYGDLDTTALHQLPAGRMPVETRLIDEEQRGEAFEFIRRRLREGRQAFVVCPLVTLSDKQPGRAAEAEAERLRAGELRDFEVGLLHGQMHSTEKAAAMCAFAAGETDVLVATTVIEVGIDVANATVMVIEGAERFGVSQLHQLRGRVGRGEHPSQCLLFSERAGELARKRLQAVAGETDGFRLAEVDLGLRGEGEILGTRQSGLPRFAVASLPEDMPTLLAAREEVLELLRRHGSLEDAALGPLLDAARRRFGAGAADPIPL
ncbi:MAG: ATP-dependent DNA helicase RecG [Solirubrobacterales bacterium]|nr:ATP-dependent DNA helicase RecG [Solirubrobacterales bacterium]